MFNGGSFEAFMCRYWIENEAWFSEYAGQPMPEIARQYVGAYQSAQASARRGRTWPVS